MKHADVSWYRSLRPICAHLCALASEPDSDRHSSSRDPRLHKPRRSAWHGQVTSGWPTLHPSGMLASAQQFGQRARRAQHEPRGAEQSRVESRPPPAPQGSRTACSVARYTRCVPPHQGPGRRSLAIRGTVTAPQSQLTMRSACTMHAQCMHTPHNPSGAPPHTPALLWGHQALL